MVDSLSIAHLSDITTYTRLDTNPLTTATTELTQILNTLLTDKDLNIPLHKLMVKNAKLGKFRILAKLHKTKFGIRPIINNTNHITSQIMKISRFNHTTNSTLYKHVFKRLSTSTTKVC